MLQIPGFLRHDADATRPARSLFEILGTLGPTAVPDRSETTPFRAACVLEVARRTRPGGPPRPIPHRSRATSGAAAPGDR